MPSSATQVDSKIQSDKFKQAARDFECDEEEARWDMQLKKVAKRESAPDMPNRPE
jgi:hypothetical protein